MHVHEPPMCLLFSEVNTGPLKMELQMIESMVCVLGTEPEFSMRVASVLN